MNPLGENKMSYTMEMKKKAVEDFWNQKDKDNLLSIRTYAALIGVPYYTFRDWYRDPRYNRRFFCSRKLNQKQSQISALCMFAFVEVK